MTERNKRDRVSRKRDTVPRERDTFSRETLEAEIKALCSHVDFLKKENAYLKDETARSKRKFRELEIHDCQFQSDIYTYLRVASKKRGYILETERDVVSLRGNHSTTLLLPINNLPTFPGPLRVPTRVQEEEGHSPSEDEEEEVQNREGQSPSETDKKKEYPVIPLTTTVQTIPVVPLPGRKKVRSYHLPLVSIRNFTKSVWDRERSVQILSEMGLHRVNFRSKAVSYSAMHSMFIRRFDHDCAKKNRAWRVFIRKYDKLTEDQTQ